MDIDRENDRRHCRITQKEAIAKEQNLKSRQMSKGPRVVLGTQSALILRLFHTKKLNIWAVPLA
jgi:hypothetical protein